MASEFETPEQSVDRITAAADKLNPVHAEAFRRIALDNLAAFRDEQRRDSVYRFSIPRRYSNNPEFFLVFDAFVGVFLEPVQLALNDLQLLARLEGPETITFGRFAEVVPSNESISLANHEALRIVNNELRQIAQDMGMDLFGPDFDLEKFSSDAENLRG